MKNMETIKIYVRGHNLFDIFYGRYKREAQTDILKKYIDAAPRDTFKDIQKRVWRNNAHRLTNGFAKKYV